MSLATRFAAAVSKRPGVVLGVLFSSLGAGHLALWTRDGTTAFAASVTAGDPGTALAALATYGVQHPAYVVALLGGLVLATWTR